MKFSIWPTLCTIFFCYYFLSFKENVFKIYYDTVMQHYTFNETLKITICSPLELLNKQCVRGRKMEDKKEKFDCEMLKKKVPLGCLTRGFHKMKASKIIKTIRKCNPDDIFGSKLRLIMYKRTMENTEDIETNQQTFKAFDYDRNITYLNNGDYCGSFVFSNFTKDPDSGKTSFKSKIYYQISIEGVSSPIKIYVNQQFTTRTYFNFHQLYFRSVDDEFWKQMTDDLKYDDPDFLGGLETKNLTDEIEDMYLDDLSVDSTTSRTTIDDRLNQSSLSKNSTTKQVQVSRKYVPKQNVTIYAYLLHTRIYKLPYPYESNCIDYENYYGKINNKTVKSREMCLIECYKYFSNYYKFLYTEEEDITLKYDIIDYSGCSRYCKRPNCISNYFHTRKYKATYNIGDEKQEQDEIITKDRNDSLIEQEDQSRQMNNKIKLQFNEYINVVRAKPVFTPILAITYLFGLFNVFIGDCVLDYLDKMTYNFIIILITGTNLLDLNRKLIYAFIDLKKLIAKVTKDSSRQTNVFHKNLKLKRKLFELTNKFSKKIVNTNSIAPNFESLQHDKALNQSDKNRLLKFLNLKNYQNKKKFLENNQINRRPSIIKPKNKISFTTRLESLMGNLKKEQLINFNRLFCFYLLLIYSIYSLVDVLVERSNNPTVTYTDFLKSGGNFLDISVSFCFKIEDLLSKHANDEINRKLIQDSDISDILSGMNTTIDYQKEKKREAMFLTELYSKYNLEQLDNLTMNLSSLVDSIYLGLKEYSFDNKNHSQTPANFTTYNPTDLDPKVFYFRNFKCFKFFLSNPDYYFIVEIEYSFVSFSFNANIGGYFIEQNQEYPNKNSNMQSGTVDFVVRKTTSYYRYCANFSTTYGCASEGECQNKCMESNYSSKLQKLNVNYPVKLVDGNRKMHFDNESESSKKEKQFYKGCNFKFESKIDPCSDLKFQKFSTVNYHPKEVFLYLSNDISQKRVENRFKNVEIVNYELNIGSLIYDLNLNVLFNFLISLVLLIYGKMLRSESKRVYFNQKIKLRLKNILLFFKFLILFFGFTWHLNFVIINYVYYNEAITSNLFDRPQNQLIIPNITFCVGNQFHIYNETSLRKSRTQGKTGNQMIKDFPSVMDIFEFVEYKDQELNVVKLNEKEIKFLDSNSHYKKAIYVSTYFLFESKCYTFSLLNNYNPLLFLTYNSVYPIKFVLKPLQSFHYSVFIHDYRKYSFKNYARITKDLSFHFYYEAVRITYDEEMTFKIYLNHYLRNEETYFFDDQADYFSFLLDDFAKEKNRSTTRLPLIKKYFDFEIDNKLFIDWYKEKHFKFEKDIFIQDLSYPVYRIIFEKYSSVNYTSVELDPLFLEQHVQYRSRLSFNEVILYMGTLISFWLNTCYMGLTSFLRRLFGSVKYYFKQLFSYFR